MVRILAGTLVEIGKGRTEPEELKGILESRDRSAAGPTAPARGLTLMEIKYPEWEPDFFNRKQKATAEKI